MSRPCTHKVNPSKQGSVWLFFLGISVLVGKFEATERTEIFVSQQLFSTVGTKGKINSNFGVNEFIWENVTSDLSYRVFF